MRHFIFKTAALSAVIAAAAASTAFAGQWKNNETGWWYQTEYGYLSNAWYWIDGNGDGTAEAYCFDENGYLYTNTTTPDGPQVNADGAWTENGVVKTQPVTEQNSPKVSIDTEYQRNDSIASGYMTRSEYAGGGESVFIDVVLASGGGGWDFFGGVALIGENLYRSEDGYGNSIEFTYDEAGNFIVTKCTPGENFSFPGIEGVYNKV